MVMTPSVAEAVMTSTRLGLLLMALARPVATRARVLSAS